MNSFNIIILFILFIQICYCQYIMTSYSKNKMIEHLLKLYKYIFINYSFDYLYNTDFQDINNSDYKIYDIQVSNFNLTNQDYIPYYLIEKNIIVFSEHKIGITFKYKTNKNKENYSFFYFNPKSIVLKENKAFKSEFFMDIQIDEKNCTYDSRDDSKILNTIKEHFLNKNMHILQSAFHNAMKKGINELYLKYELITFRMNDIFSSEKIYQYIDLYRFSGSCDSKYNKNTVQCYYIGGGYEALDNKKKDLNEEIVGSDFFTDNNKFKLFISHKILNKFIEKINLLSYKNVFNNSVILKNFSDDCKNYFENFDDCEINKIYFQYQNIQFDFNLKTVNSTFDFLIETNLKNFTMTVIFIGNFSASYFVTTLNLVSKNIKVNNITLNNNVTSKPDKNLINYINSYLQNKEFYFVDNNGIELYDFFKLIQNTTIVKGGIIIEGEGLLKSVQDIFE